MEFITMTSMNVNLSENLQDFVKTQASRAGCSPEDFVENLIREHRKKMQKADLEAKLVEAIEQLDRGEGLDLSPDYFDQLKQNVIARFTKGSGL